MTCDAIGSSDDDAGPPADAVAAIKAMLIEMTGMVVEDEPGPRLTKVDACLLEAWRVASGDPDDQVGWIGRVKECGLTTWPFWLKHLKFAIFVEDRRCVSAQFFSRPPTPGFSLTLGNNLYSIRYDGDRLQDPILGIRVLSCRLGQESFRLTQLLKEAWMHMRACTLIIGWAGGF